MVRGPALSAGKESEMDYNEILNQISCAYQKILGPNLAGIYVHGSAAFGCFNWNKSDIDFIVVTKTPPAQEQKCELIQVLLNLKKDCPPKGLEMSLVLEEHCRHFSYPARFELHFSNFHMDRCKKDLKGYCASMNGTDKDLAAHFTVVREAGIVLWGKDIPSVFGPVPKNDYLDSIKCDIENAREGIAEEPVYIILNLCRVLAFLQEGSVLSKEQGGLWAKDSLPSVYTPLIEEALGSYRTGKTFSADSLPLREFSDYMLELIFPAVK